MNGLDAQLPRGHLLAPAIPIMLMPLVTSTADRTLARNFANHRVQRVDSKRNSARLARYLAAGWVLSNPPIIVTPQRSQTRHSHLVELRLVTNTSNTAAPHDPQLRTVKIVRGFKGVGSLLDVQV